MSPSEDTIHHFVPPYRELVVARESAAFPDRIEQRRGSALVWCLGAPPAAASLEFARRRPPGVALIIVLPPTDDLGHPDHLLRAVELCRPHSILPHHQPNVVDLTALLSRPPDDLPGEVTDYLGWRGLSIDLETRRLIRKTMDLSQDLSTVNGLARALYLSRRALGRRFTSRGLPVPSHWLHFGRVLRSALRLQDTDDTLLSAATRLGYPDGFALSNQMFRLTGVRPVVAREHLGWEWLLEEWLLKEAESGGISREVATVILGSPPVRASEPGVHGPMDPPSTRAPLRRVEAPERAPTTGVRVGGRPADA